MSRLKASLNIAPKAVGFTADGDVVISGMGKEKNLTCYRINHEKLTSLVSLQMPDSESLSSLSCHSQASFTLIAVACEKGTCIYVKENDQIQLETMIPSNTRIKMVRFSSTGNLLATVSNDDVLTLLDVRDWTVLMHIKPVDNIQQVDVDANEEHLSICTPTVLMVLSIQDKKVVQVIESPKLHKKSTTFSTCRYSTDQEGQERLFAVVNTFNGHSFLCTWEIRARGFVQYPTTKVRNVAISRSEITAFELSTRGDALAYGTKDGHIGLVNIKHLRPVKRFRKVHSREIVSMSFNSSDTYIASVGQDSEFRVTSLRHVDKRSGTGLGTLLFVVLDMMLFALMMHLIVQMVDQGTLVLP